MDHAQHNKIANFIWGIADDILRDVYVRGKYRDVILPMTVIRRLDAVLEPTKESVLQMKENLDRGGVANQDPALRQAAGEAFYNVSTFTLSRLLANPKQLRANFAAYLDGFSPNIREILDKFEFHNQLPRLEESDTLGALIERFLDPQVNLSPRPVLDVHGQIKHPGLDNHAMGTIFEELIRRFNEENNEEAGEHFTPRDVVTLMANLIFLPLADQLESGTYTVYDGACGTGGMLTVAEESLQELAKQHNKQVSIHLFGQEVNAETYAISKADLLLKGEGADADNIGYGSTLSSDAFPTRQFDFMLSNPPYGKSWKNDLERLGGKKGDVRDPRFVVSHKDNPELNLITRTSDGQLMFLINKLAKVKHDSKLGSRIAEVHNGSALFTGDAGQGESNIRGWILENDWLEAIIALPLNIFYNTGIATYIWILTNRKAEHRKGKVQLIDATSWFKPLRRNLGKRNRELTSMDIRRVCDALLQFRETPESKIFPNEAFGYLKVTVERPWRLRDIDPLRVHSASEIKLLKATQVHDPNGHPVIRKIYSTGTAPDPLNGRFEVRIDGESRTVEYEPNADLRDAERVPLLELDGVAGYFQREVLPFIPDAWVDTKRTQRGHEISFARYFFEPSPTRTTEEIRTDLVEMEAHSAKLLREIIGTGAR